MANIAPLEFVQRRQQGTVAELAEKILDLAQRDASLRRSRLADALGQMLALDDAAGTKGCRTLNGVCEFADVARKRVVPERLQRLSGETKDASVESATVVREKACRQQLDVVFTLS